MVNGRMSALFALPLEKAENVLTRTAGFMLTRRQRLCASFLVACAFVRLTYNYLHSLIRYLRMFYASILCAPNGQNFAKLCKKEQNRTERNRTAVVVALKWRRWTNEQTNERQRSSGFDRSITAEVATLKRTESQTRRPPGGKEKATHYLTKQCRREARSEKFDSSSNFILSLSFSRSVYFYFSLSHCSCPLLLLLPIHLILLFLRSVVRSFALSLARSLSISLSLSASICVVTVVCQSASFIARSTIIVVSLSLSAQLQYFRTFKHSGQNIDQVIENCANINN